jgi:hypothetical protein
MAASMPAAVGVEESLYYLQGTNPIVATSDTEAVGFNFGVKFTTSPTVNTIRGIAYYKHTSQSGSGSVSLYRIDNAASTLIETKAFSGHTGSGWKRVDLNTPYAASTSYGYIASVWVPAVSGTIYFYSDSNSYVSTVVSTTNSYITAPSSNATTHLNNFLQKNGVYGYGALAIPANEFGKSNYSADVVVRGDTGNGFTAATYIARTNSKSSTIVNVSTTEVWAAGSLIVVCVASDNTGTTDAAGADDIVSVIDAKGNTYTLAAGYRNGQGAAQGGAHASIWYSVLTTGLAISDFIRVTNTATGYARAFTVAAYPRNGGTVSVAGTAGAAGDGGTDPVCTLSGLSSAKYLFVGCVADENSALVGYTSGFTEIFTSGAVTTGGAADSNVAVGQYYSIDTASTGKTFTPPTVGDAAAVLVAFKVT